MTSRNAVKTALANLVKAHTNMENTTAAKNRLKVAIENHLKTTVNKTKATNHVLKRMGYTYSNQNRANIVRIILPKPVNNHVSFNMSQLFKVFNVTNKKIKRRSTASRMLGI